MLLILRGTLYFDRVVLYRDFHLGMEGTAELAFGAFYFDQVAFLKGDGDASRDDNRCSSDTGHFYAS